MNAAPQVLLLLLGASLLARTQEIKFIDLSHVEQRTTLRHPEQKCDDEQSCVGGGIGGGSVADGAPDRRDPHVLGVALDHISTSEITLDPFEVDFRILNSGLAPIDVPVCAHLSDLQPGDEALPFTYFSVALVVQLDGEDSKGRRAGGLGWVELYGTADHTGTIVALQPGQWIRVKARVKLHTWPSETANAQLRGDFWLRRNVFKPVLGGGFTETTNLYPNTTLFPGIPIRFAPTRSTQKSGLDH